ncbi:MAG: hypothetical protein IPH07_26275 [Deltaproteobacteria bacterium]|nr:hypothetical protein [Deltaproteobacteria bacterium]MBK8718269.1 hypothetical protein [Deltaproteobacteria bacterium]MBP7291093.1 hypothetical protein [Nannocystaceae bacterium]
MIATRSQRACLGLALTLGTVACDRAGESPAPVAETPPAAGAPGDAPPDTPPPSPVPHEPARSDAAASPGPHIEAITATSWRIEERALLELALELWSQASVCEPTTGGCRLSTIAPTSVLTRLGLVRGDLLQRLAGVTLGDAASWRDALHAATAQGRFALELSRDGTPHNHRYRLRTLVRRRARADEVERAIDLLADAVVPSGEDRRVVDEAALELFALAYALDPEATTRALVGGDGRVVAIAGAPVDSPLSFVAALAAAKTAGTEVELQLEDAAGAGRRRVVLEPRAGLVDPTLLTAARASLPDAGPRLAPEPLASPSASSTAAVTESYTIPAAALKRWEDAPLDFAKLVRIVPDSSGRGFKLYGIRRTPSAGDLSPHELGFRNGDLVTHINGTAVTDMESLMGVFDKRRTTDRWTIEIERRGAPVTLVITRGS